MYFQRPAQQAACHLGQGVLKGVSHNAFSAPRKPRKDVDAWREPPANALSSRAQAKDLADEGSGDHTGLIIPHIW